MNSTPNTDSSTLAAEFIQHGHVILHDCFSQEAAQEMVEDAYRLLGYSPDDPATWEKPLAFLYPSRSIPIREFAPGLWDAIAELLGGEDRIGHRDCPMGQCVINFRRGADEPWTPPGPEVKGWHIDGNFFRHFLDSPEQGLLVVPIFSDIGPRGGGTVFAADSVPIVARLLRDHPEGMMLEQIDFPSLVAQCEDFRELAGRVGDAALFHPLMLHSFAQNHSGRPRFITNVCVSLKEPLCFNRPDGAYSPVEQAILHGLGTDDLDFHPTAPRERVQRPR